MLGACTTTELFHKLELHGLCGCRVAPSDSVSSKQRTYRATCMIFGSQEKQTGDETTRRCSKSGKAVVCKCRLSSTSTMGSLAGADRGLVVVIMGVSGAGKSTVGELLSKELGCPFLDADDFHPAENKEKMRNGIPLSEDNRWPWLEKLRHAMEDYINNGKTVVLACSALRRSYRTVLRSAAARNRKGKVVFVHLKGSYELFASRLTARHKEGKHFMPPTLLQSQLDLLEDEDEIDIECSSFINVDASLSPEAIVNHVKHGLHGGNTE